MERERKGTLSPPFCPTPRFRPVSDSTFWRAPASVPHLSQRAVHVWRAPLDPGPEVRDALATLLSPEEQARAASFRFDRDRDAFIVARGQLRLLLSGYLGRLPEDVAFEYGAQGKPALASPTDLQFNLSRAGDMALYAFAWGRQLGVDVEPVRALPDADATVERFFSAEEVAVYRGLPEDQRPAAFFACWTRKEAFIKALGEGLTHPLDAFDVTVRPDEPATLLRVRGASTPRRWHLQSLPVGPGMAATVAMEGRPCPVACWQTSHLVDAYLSEALALAS